MMPAPEGKDKKRKAPLAATSSDPQHKKSKKQKTTKDVPTTATKEPNIVPNPSTTGLQTTAESNLAAITSKKSRKRAADFLSDEEGVDVAISQPKAVDAGSKPTKKKSKQTVNKKTTTKDVPNVEAIATTAHLESVNDDKPKKAQKALWAKVDAFEKPARANKKQASEWPNEEMKKSVKKALSNGDSLTADGVNGVLEHSTEEDVEVTTANLQPSTSMQAEAQRTVDKEMADEVATEDESDNTGAALLVGFDSDDEDSGEDTGLDPAKMKDLELSKKSRKKLRQALRKGKNDEPGAVYVGRIPHGFHENEMRQYFSQFGTITNLRLSRNRKTGASKHFAFVEFESNEVAKIVAQTMDNYLMFGHILKCKYAPIDSLHPDVWKGANKRFKKVPFNKIEKRKLEEPKTKEQWVGKIAREQSKRAAKAEIMKSMGYEYDLPQIQTVDEALEKKQPVQEAEAKTIEPAAGPKEPTGAVEPPNGVPKDAVALAEKNKPKKFKKSAVSAEIVPESVAEAVIEVAAQNKVKKSRKVAQESIVPVANGEGQTKALAEVTESIASKTDKKDKKDKKKNKKLVAEAETAVPAKGSSSTEPPKFAFHPDEVKQLAQVKPKKQKKTKGTDQVAVQMQLNAELNEAVEPLKEEAIESDAEITATAAVLPTTDGGEKKAKVKAKKQKHKSDVLAKSAEKPKKVKKMKKSAAA